MDTLKKYTLSDIEEVLVGNIWYKIDSIHQVFLSNFLNIHSEFDGMVLIKDGKETIILQSSICGYRLK